MCKSNYIKVYIYLQILFFYILLFRSSFMFYLAMVQVFLFPRLRTKLSFLLDFPAENT